MNNYNIKFDGKPSEEIRTELKAHGFCWSPKNGVWWTNSAEDLSAWITTLEGAELIERPKKSGQYCPNSKNGNKICSAREAAQKNIVLPDYKWEIRDVTQTDNTIGKYVSYGDTNKYQIENDAKVAGRAFIADYKTRYGGTNNSRDFKKLFNAAIKAGLFYNIVKVSVTATRGCYGVAKATPTHRTNYKLIDVSQYSDRSANEFCHPSYHWDYQIFKMMCSAYGSNNDDIMTDYFYNTQCLQGNFGSIRG